MVFSFFRSTSELDMEPSGRRSVSKKVGDVMKRIQTYIEAQQKEALASNPDYNPPPALSQKLLTTYSTALAEKPKLLEYFLSTGYDKTLDVVYNVTLCGKEAIKALQGQIDIMTKENKVNPNLSYDNVSSLAEKLDVRIVITDLNTSNPFLLSPGLLLDFRPKKKEGEEATKKKEKKEKKERVFHSAIMIGPWYLEFNESNLVVPRKCLLASTLRYCENNSIKVGQCTLHEVKEKVADIIIEFNTERNFSLTGHNCQTFVDCVLNSMDYKWEGMDASTVLGKYLTVLRTKGKHLREVYVKKNKLYEVLDIKELEGKEGSKGEKKKREHKGKTTEATAPAPAPAPEKAAAVGGGGGGLAGATAATAAMLFGQPKIGLKDVVIDWDKLKKEAEEYASQHEQGINPNTMILGKLQEEAPSMYTDVPKRPFKTFTDIGFVEFLNPMHRTQMEDGHCMMDGFDGDDTSGFFAVYDGHGGTEAVEFVQSYLHRFFMEEIQKTPTEVKDSFERAFARIDKELAEREMALDCGSTSVCCFIRNEAEGKKLYTANCGDARAVISRGGSAFRLSHDHKATNIDPEELARIKEAKGFVANGRVNRVLAITRSLGDIEMKRWVISTPYFSEVTLSPSDDFLIIACDGLWDVLEDQDAVDLLRKEAHRDAQMLTHMLMETAKQLGSKDNITIMVIKL